MKKHLSSDWTFVYKIVIPTIWTLVILLIIALVLWDSHDLRAFFILLILLPTFFMIKIKRVTYDDKFIYISNFRTEWTYELSNVKSINEANMASFDPFFEVEIIEETGVKKFDFMPRIFEYLYYLFNREMTGRLLELKNKINDNRVMT